MNQITLLFLAFAGGIFLAIQGGFNAQLGVLLQNPLLASLVAFFCSASFAFLGLAFSMKNYPTVDQLKEIPLYLWFSGALFSVLGISLYYYTIPRLGISTMISFGLSGQLIFSVIAGHFGWFGMPAEPIVYKKIIGVTAMILGIVLINK
ncbi:DMT family transporter [Chondrinema litorale]|uniref:DMT family transporter n=1 Tax=Chondrinema litorale TaxID=2994555 RepID=UPI002543AB4F|nr:DMT family transporter [Chondrinema litorale]UZR97928.1 DMT family transporter [Chondrinema litorale]